MHDASMRSKTFDLAFIWLPLAIALFVGGMSKTLGNPLLLFVIVSWIFGYGHAAALLSRLYLDPKTRSHHWFLSWYLPIICLVFVLGLHHLNPIIIPSAFILARFFHYIRQSHGFARILGRQYAAGALHFILIYLLPTFVLLIYLSTSQSFFGHRFQVLELFAVHPPQWAVLSLVLTATVWFLIRYQQAKSTSQKNYEMYMLTHVAIFTIGYLSFRKLETGVLMLIVWHGVQYILFVWHYSNRRWANTKDFCESLFSTKKLHWAILGLALTTMIIYGGLHALDDLWAINAFLIGTMAINFHHYIVDAYIWRRSSA